jgi:hypothetical protein
MDDELYEKSLGLLTCAAETRVKYYDNCNSGTSDAWIGDQALLDKLPDIVSHIFRRMLISHIFVLGLPGTRHLARSSFYSTG